MIIYHNKEKRHTFNSFKENVSKTYPSYEIVNIRQLFITGKGWTIVDDKFTPEFIKAAKSAKVEHVNLVLQNKDNSLDIKHSDFSLFL